LSVVLFSFFLVKLFNVFFVHSIIFKYKSIFFFKQDQQVGKNGNKGHKKQKTREFGEKAVERGGGDNDDDGGGGGRRKMKKK